MNKPLKRHEALKPLSREHHQGLLLCWKIRQGFKLNVEPERMKKYTEWFKLNYLHPHFDTEEKYVFPILGDDHELVKRALAEHRRLKELFDANNKIEEALRQIEEELDLHIRFEERVLFTEIQQAATAGQLAKIEKHHEGLPFSENEWKDKFWTS